MLLEDLGYCVFEQGRSASVEHMLLCLARKDKVDEMFGIGSRTPHIGAMIKESVLLWLDMMILVIR